MSVRELSVGLHASGLRFAIVVSRFNDLLTKQLLGGAVDCLVRHGAAEKDITVAWVPGANESPIAAKRLAAPDRADAVIVLGAVVQGSTTHAGLINSQVSRSLAQIALDSGVPVINGVVAADNLEQAIERSGTKAGNKGWHAAQAAIEMANLLRVIDGQ
jgi:6,7-dimethyl-8-ribityllumazine synthase